MIDVTGKIPSYQLERLKKLSRKDLIKVYCLCYLHAANEKKRLVDAYNEASEEMYAKLRRSGETSAALMRVLDDHRISFRPLNNWWR